MRAVVRLTEVQGAASRATCWLCERACGPSCPGSGACGSLHGGCGGGSGGGGGGGGGCGVCGAGPVRHWSVFVFESPSLLPLPPPPPSSPLPPPGFSQPRLGRQQSRGSEASVVVTTAREGDRLGFHSSGRRGVPCRAVACRAVLHVATYR